jgi:hypothetical protein
MVSGRDGTKKGRGSLNIGEHAFRRSCPDSSMYVRREPAIFPFSNLSTEERRSTAHGSWSSALRRASTEWRRRQCVRTAAPTAPRPGEAGGCEGAAGGRCEPVMCSATALAIVTYGVGKEQLGPAAGVGRRAGHRGLRRPRRSPAAPPAARLHRLERPHARRGECRLQTPARRGRRFESVRGLSGMPSKWACCVV